MTDITNDKNPSILIVEDDPHYSKLMKRWLEKTSQYSPQITIAHSLLEAKKQAQLRVFDLILLDLMLPDSSGIETYDEMAKLYPTSMIWVVTGQEELSLIEKLKTIEGKNYFLKTHSPIRVLVEFIDRFLQKTPDKFKQTSHQHFFIAQALNEIKMPIFAIDTCLDNFGSEKAAKIAKNQTKQLNDFINRLIADKPLDAGQLRPQLKSEKLGPFIERKMEEYKFMAEAKNKQLQLKFNKDMPEALLDWTLSEHLLDKLFITALKSAKSKISIDIAIQENWRKLNDFIFKLKYDGPPLAREVEMKLLSSELAESLKSGADKNQESPEDDFTFCQRLAHALGADIDVDNHSNQGVTFSILFPMQHISNTSVHQKHILIIEDDLDSFNLLAKRLKAHQYQCSIATSVEQAVGGWNKDNRIPDLVLLDLGLANASGFAFLSHIKTWNAEHPTQRVPVIVLSGYHDREVVNHAMDMGAQAFIAKPYRSGDLLKTITAYI